jgi:succinate-acetate transporter protein
MLEILIIAVVSGLALWGVFALVMLANALATSKELGVLRDD